MLVSWVLLRLFVDFKIRPEFFIWIFPYFTYPFCNIATSASTFMTVGIAHERYLVVKNSIQLNDQSMSNTRSESFRLILYVLPVVLFSIVYNIPIFLCYEVQQTPSDNSTHLKISFTELRKNNLFKMYYVHWTRLVISSIIPFCMLIYYNYVLYQMIKTNFLLQNVREY